MKTQFDDSAEYLATYTTHVLDPSVDFDVNAKIVFMGEGFIAISAHKRFLACMQPDMVCKVNILTKRFRAFRTLIRALARMNTLVLALGQFRFEGFVTVTAWERANIRMNAAMMHI